MTGNLEGSVEGPVEGRINIQLLLQAGAANAVTLRSSRPQLAQKIMVGCSPARAAERAGLMFSLCGKAQRIAAELACEAAQNSAPDAQTCAAREQRVLIEAGLEHAWQLLLHWPQRLSDVTHNHMLQNRASLAALRKASLDPQRFVAVLDDELRAVFLGENAADWLQRDLAAFDAWRQQAANVPTTSSSATSMASSMASSMAALFATKEAATDQGLAATPLLPPLDNCAVWSPAQCAALAQRAFADANFSAQPTWQGGAAETGAIARQQAQPLLAEWIARRGRGQGARLLARLIELAELPSRLKLRSGAVANVDVQAKVKTNTKAFTLDDNVGLSLVETSRGVLMHCVRLADGKVADYRIVAPTEWNFHPAGPLQQALALLPADADIVARAQAICQSLDPCVAFEIDVVDLR